jgi:hypothetical protein
MTMAAKQSSTQTTPAKPKPKPPAMPQTIFISEKRGTEPAPPPSRGS